MGRYARLLAAALLSEDGTLPAAMRRWGLCYIDWLRLHYTRSVCCRRDGFYSDDYFMLITCDACADSR